jgi:hypothetical protein
VTLLARASADDPHAGELLRQALPGTAGLITGMQASVEALMTIVNAIPPQTVVLAPAAAALCQRILNVLPASTGPAVRAYWLHNLGIRLTGLGRPAEACRSATRPSPCTGSWPPPARTATAPTSPAR